MPSPHDIPCWDSIWAGCLRRIRRWRVPSNWSGPEWLEEMESEGLLAAFTARGGYEPGLGMSFLSYMHMKVIGHIITRYRREWSFAKRLRAASCDPVGSSEMPPASDVEETLGGLGACDSRILRGLFWEGCREADLAREMGISQQAISKRKKRILTDLRPQFGEFV
jgi:DNA-directed RNA polymerase specialized sigma subunit